jgi:hypothetical protein
MQRSLFAELNALAEEISAGASTKAAADKSAAPVPADPGGYKGHSSHPSASADNGCQAASEGERSREYEADLKKQQGPVGVDSTPEMSQEGRQDDVQLNIGAHVAATGEDPATEKDYKGTKDDPGTSAPAKANDGEKYSTVTFKEARDICSNLGNKVLAHYINFGAPTEKKSEGLVGGQHKLDVDNDGKIEGADLAKLRNGGAKKAPPFAKSENAHEAAESPAEEAEEHKEAAYREGYELAQHMAWEKAASEQVVRDMCVGALKEADDMAELVIGFLSKQAEADVDDAASSEDHSGGAADAASGAGDAPPESAMPEDAPEGDDMGGDMGGEPTDDQAVQELAMALEELGIPPEALLEALSGGGDAGGDAGGTPAGMGGGEMPPEMAGAPKMAAAKRAAVKRAALAELQTIGQAVVNFKRAGRFQVKEARTKKSRLLRDEMKQHVMELMSR